jgi:hypothetical protein
MKRSRAYRVTVAWAARVDKVLQNDYYSLRQASRTILRQLQMLPRRFECRFTRIAQTRSVLGLIGDISKGELSSQSPLIPVSLETHANVPRQEYLQQVGLVKVHVYPQGDHYRGESRMKIAYLGSGEVFVDVEQQGSLILYLSEDTTTLTGTIQFGAPDIRAIKMKIWRDWGEMHRKFLPSGPVQLRLVRH